MRIYDLVMTHKLDSDDFFIHRIQQHCAERGLNFFLIEPLWIESFHERVTRGEVWARCLLNMHSEHHLPEDVFHRLVRLCHEKGTQVIDPPDLALACFDKAQLHPKLAAAGLNVPPTLFVPLEQLAGFRLSEPDQAFLGSPFVIKPNLGYGRRGVVLDATSEADLARSSSAWPHCTYLLQKRVVPRMLLGEPAYFRVYYVFGWVASCWWNCYTDRYRLLLPEEIEKHGLHRLAEIGAKLGRLTGMNFFSTEVALTEAGQFCLIDYVNDQCHMLTQSSHPGMGVPDSLVATVAAKLVDGAHQLINSRKG